MNNEYNQKPFISADRVVPEFTVTSVVMGIILAVVFGGANAYLGLRVGMTVSASIPAAVISMGIIRMILKKDSILENNMVQTIGSAGESLAAGAIFTMPVLFMWAAERGTDNPSLMEMFLIALFGGVLGVLFMVPLRSALIVKEDGILPYPEGEACAKVLLAGEKAGAGAGTVFSGMGIAAVYKFLTDGLKLFPGEVDYSFKRYNGAGFGIDVLPALAGVGYICGLRISSFIFAGGLLAWLALMPMIAIFGGGSVIFPASAPISELGASGIWSSYVRYIGAGAVAAGGIISLVKSIPLIIETFRKTFSLRKKAEKTELRTDKDLSMPVIVTGIIIVILIMWIVPVIPVNLFGAVIIAVFGFFFATVSSRMVGLVGSSNNPVSGMAIATLIIAAFLLKITGSAGNSGMIAAITIGSVICIIAAMAGDTSQDLKTGYILGATPKKQQIGELIGALVSAAAIGGILYLLNHAWGFQSAELPAPQATLMKLVVEGVMGESLPWGLVLAGVAIAFAVELLRIPVLPFAVGLYLPIHLSAAIVTGGVVRACLEMRKSASEEDRKDSIDRGVLYASGLIAGEGLVGILLAVFAVIPIGKSVLGERLGNLLGFSLGNIGSLIFFALLIASIFVFALKNKNKEKAR